MGIGLCLLIAGSGASTWSLCGAVKVATRASDPEGGSLSNSFLITQTMALNVRTWTVVLVAEIPILDKRLLNRLRFAPGRMICRALVVTLDFARELPQLSKDGQTHNAD